MTRTPSAYTEGYARARVYDQAAADNYIRHTTMGDSELDPIMEELSSLSPAVLHHFIYAGIEQRDEALRKAPRMLRDFFEALDEPPPWVDFDAFSSGGSRLPRERGPHARRMSSRGCWWRAFRR